MDRLTKDDVERLRHCFIRGLIFAARETENKPENFNPRHLIDYIEVIDKLAIMESMIDRDPNVFACGVLKHAA